MVLTSYFSVHVCLCLGFVNIISIQTTLPIITPTPLESNDDGIHWDDGITAIIQEQVPVCFSCLHQLGEFSVLGLKRVLFLCCSLPKGGFDSKVTQFNWKYSIQLCNKYITHYSSFWLAEKSIIDEPGSSKSNTTFQEYLLHISLTCMLL